MHIALVSAEFPPAIDGIGDHSWQLGLQLVRDGHAVTVVTSPTSGMRPPLDGLAIRDAVPLHGPAGTASLPDVLATISPRPEWMLLQYNPFSFGRFGHCPALPAAVEKIQHAGTRFAPIFHETMVPRWPWKFAVMRVWQSATFRRLCRLADTSFVSTMRWQPQVARVRPGLPCHHLPVGSTIPLCEIAPAEARAALGLRPNTIHLGAFGQAHISRHFDWIAHTADAFLRAGHEVALVYAGPHGDAFRALKPAAPLIDLGVQPADRLGLCLRAMDLVLAPYSDGISTRRSSAAVPIQHGIPVATTRSRWTDRVFLDAPPSGLLLSGATDPERFSRDVLAWHARSLRPAPNNDLMHFYRDQFSWSHAAATIGDALATAAAH